MNYSHDREKKQHQRKKVYIETHGCQMNVSDSERAATRLGPTQRRLAVAGLALISVAALVGLLVWDVPLAPF